MKKYYSSFYAKLILSLLGMFILAFIIFYDSNDLFKLPFNSQVWGTASDWVMITVTFGTAYWLVMTFKEQKRSNDILSNKDRREILLVFTVKRYEEHSMLFLELTLNHNVAYNAYFNFTQSKVDIYENLIDEINIGSKKYFAVIDDKILKKEFWGELIIAFIEFHDMDGRRYIQNISNKYGEIVISYPNHI